MGTTSISGGGNHNVIVYGSASVIVGNGNDLISIGGSGTVLAGSGNDSVHVQGSGSISVGGGNDTLTLYGSGQITETGIHGNDTINLGTGNYSVYVQGNATVQAAYTYNPATATVPAGAGDIFERGDRFPSSHASQGSPRERLGFRRDPMSMVNATIAGGGDLQITHVNGLTVETALSGKMTLLGGSTATEFVGGSGTTVMRGGSGSDTFVGGSGSDTLIGGTGHNVFDFLASEQGGQHVIMNFVSSDVLNVEGHSLSYLMSQHDVTTRDGNTYISIDGGKTTIELQGVSETSAITRPAPVGPNSPIAGPHSPVGPNSPFGPDSPIRPDFPHFRDEKL